MFIQTEQTPNPASLKFLPGCEVMLAGTAEFISPATASAASPLAFALFQVAGVKGVFLGRDFNSRSRNYSETVANQIDDEVRKFIIEGHEEAHRLLDQNRDILDRLALALLERETLDGEEDSSLHELLIVLAHRGELFALGQNSRFGFFRCLDHDHETHCSILDMRSADRRAIRGLTNTSNEPGQNRHGGRQGFECSCA